ncbi:hypothetical protein TAL182_PA00077 (plasmid) [Rhizobium sp. TAL182]|nr:hypothetical protein [Rhizobium sp. TAL182]ARO26267.1 hypothetical protein TAL182_PA00077 [Rhizobium sp. TAL182]
MQILELRLGVEIQAAALAATRRTPEAQPAFPEFSGSVMESINFELVLRHRQSLRADQGYLKRIKKEHAAMVPFARGHSCYCE